MMRSLQSSRARQRKRPADQRDASVKVPRLTWRGIAGSDPLLCYSDSRSLKGRNSMPTIAYFFGITVLMRYNDHQPPHFHALYQGFEALVGIEDGEVIAGNLPRTASTIVRDWTLVRRTELMENWRRARALQPLNRIPGPDA